VYGKDHDMVAGNRREDVKPKLGDEDDPETADAELLQALALRLRLV